MDNTLITYVLAYGYYVYSIWKRIEIFDNGSVTQWIVKSNRKELDPQQNTGVIENTQVHLENS